LSCSIRSRSRLILLVVSLIWVTLASGCSAGAESPRTEGGARGREALSTPVLEEALGPFLTGSGELAESPERLRVRAAVTTESVPTEAQIIRVMAGLAAYTDYAVIEVNYTTKSRPSGEFQRTFSEWNSETGVLQYDVQLFAALQHDGPSLRTGRADGVTRDVLSRVLEGTEPAPVFRTISGP